MINVPVLGLVSDTLAEDTVVLRGDVMVPADLSTRASHDREILHYYGLSVAAVLLPHTTVAETMTYVRMPYPMVQLSTVGRVRAAGFTIARTFRWPHCTIDVGDDLSDSVMLRLIEAFDAPEPRPPEARFMEI
jgi:hypothetical protein